MNFTKDKISKIFYFIDKFCNNFKKTIEKQLVGNKPKKSPKMSESEVITVMTLFHYGAFRNFKHFYNN